MSKSVTGGSIKEGDIKPGINVSFDQCQSTKSRLISNDNGQVL